MTAAETSRSQGMRALLRTSGRKVTTDAGACIAVLVEDAPALDEPYKTARQKTPVYSILTAIKGVFADPRSVLTFTDEETERVYRVIKYKDTTDLVTEAWECEAQRT